MSTLHFPKRLQQVSRTFKATDPGARVVLGAACLTLVAILLLAYLR